MYDILCLLASHKGNLVFKKKPWFEVEKAFNSEFAIKHSNHAQRKAFVINTLAKEIAFVLFRGEPTSAK